MTNVDNHNLGLIDDTEDYRSAFREQVFQLIKWGYDRLDISSYNTYEEEDITGELVKELDEITQDRSYPHWVGNIHICEDSHINIDERKGKRRQRIDIEFVRVQHGPRPRFFFEAKRLSSGTHATVAKYLGAEGLGEFLSGNYCRNENEAGMLGYIQSDNAGYWSDKIRKKLDQEKYGYQLLPDNIWVMIEIITELKNCYRTKHQRVKGKSPITIYHCLLMFI